MELTILHKVHLYQLLFSTINHFSLIHESHWLFNFGIIVNCSNGWRKKACEEVHIAWCRRCAGGFFCFQWFSWAENQGLNDSFVPFQTWFSDEQILLCALCWYFRQILLLHAPYALRLNQRHFFGRQLPSDWIGLDAFSRWIKISNLSDRESAFSHRNLFTISWTGKNSIEENLDSIAGFLGRNNKVQEWPVGHKFGLWFNVVAATARFAHTTTNSSSCFRAILVKLYYAINKFI